MHGEIKLWDLQNKKMIKRILTGGVNLMTMILWSDKFIIFADNEQDNKWMKDLLKNDELRKRRNIK